MMKNTHVRTTRLLMASAATCLALALLPSEVSAQLPSGAEEAARSEAAPGRIQEQLFDTTLSPRVSPSVEVRDLILQEVPAGAEKMYFKLDSLKIDGVSVYSADDLRPIYADKLGQNVSLAELYAVSTALTNKYRNDGYILTQVIVPPQTIEGGQAKLKVVEGFIDSVSVEGTNDDAALELIQRYAAKLQTADALNVKELERYLLLISDLPGVEARSILGPSAGQPGAATMRILVERDPYDALLAADNFGSRYLGPVQGSAAGSLNSYFGNNERISGQVVVAPDGRELGYISLGYEQPINDNGTTIAVFGSHTHTEPGYTLEQFDVNGRSQFFSVTLEHPVIRSRSENLYAYTTFDWRDVDSQNNLEATRQDRIRSLRVGSRYEFLDTFFGVGINSMSVELSKGLNILGASESGDLRITRPNANPDAVKITSEVQRLQRINQDVNLLVAARGQLASNALLASEEFGVGGINYGRGFDPSEVVGDDGVAGKLELQWNQPYPASYLDNYQLFSFFDAGRVWNKDATTSSLKTDTLTSAGLGVRADFTADIKGGFAVAWPLNREVETQGDKDPRFYFNVSRDF